MFCWAVVFYFRARGIRLRVVVKVYIASKLASKVYSDSNFRDRVSKAVNLQIRWYDAG